MGEGLPEVHRTLQGEERERGDEERSDEERASWQAIGQGPRHGDPAARSEGDGGTEQPRAGEVHAKCLGQIGLIRADQDKHHAEGEEGRNAYREQANSGVR